jgi:hypothetical protein
MCPQFDSGRRHVMKKPCYAGLFHYVARSDRADSWFAPDLRGKPSCIPCLHAVKF